MKIKLFLFALFALAQAAFGQSIKITEGQPVSFKFDYDGQLPARIYIEGSITPLKEFMLSEMTITTNASGLLYSFKLTVPSLPRGKRTVYATVVFDGLESDPSNRVPLSVHPKAPFGFGLF